MLRFIASLCIVLTAFIGSPLLADVYLLKDGRILESDRAVESTDKIMLVTPDRPVGFKKSDVLLKVRGKLPPEKLYPKLSAAVPADHAQSHMHLSEWCKDNDLREQSMLHFRKAVGLLTAEAGKADSDLLLKLAGQADRLGAFDTAGQLRTTCLNLMLGQGEALGERSVDDLKALLALAGRANRGELANELRFLIAGKGTARHTLDITGFNSKLLSTLEASGPYSDQTEVQKTRTRSNLETFLEGQRLSSLKVHLTLRILEIEDYSDRFEPFDLQIAELRKRLAYVNERERSLRTSDIDPEQVKQMKKALVQSKRGLYADIRRLEEQKRNLILTPYFVIGRPLLVTAKEHMGAQDRKSKAWSIPLGKGAGDALDATDLFKRVSPAVVHLKVRTAGRAGKSGSALVLTADGIAITNAHVISQAESVEATFQDRKKTTVAALGVIAWDPQRDIALIKLKDGKYPHYAVFSDKMPSTGQKVYAIGNPNGLTNSLSDGIVSATRTEKDMALAYGLAYGRNRFYIQTTAAISGGSSGGPLMNDRGEVIGITTFRAKTGQSLNFAVPTVEVVQLIKGVHDLVPFKRVKDMSPVLATVCGGWFPRSMKEQLEGVSVGDAIELYADVVMTFCGEPGFTDGLVGPDYVVSNRFMEHPQGEDVVGILFAKPLVRLSSLPSKKTDKEK